MSIQYYHYNVSIIPPLVKFLVYIPTVNAYKFNVLPCQLYNLLIPISQTFTIFAVYHSSNDPDKEILATNKQLNVT